MLVIGWSNGSPNNRTGAGYGVRILRVDRDRHFDRTWSSVAIEIEKVGTAQVNLSASFWRGCIELRSARIGKWMLDEDIAPWPYGKPPGIVVMLAL